VELDAFHVDEVGPASRPRVMPSPVDSQEFEVYFHALPTPPVASTTALALKATSLPVGRQ